MALAGGDWPHRLDRGPIAGVWMPESHLATIAILGLLAIPALINTACIGLMHQEWQAH